MATTMHCHYCNTIKSALLYVRAAHVWACATCYMELMHIARDEHDHTILAACAGAA
jgi:hypothetical protein